MASKDELKNKQQTLGENQPMDGLKPESVAEVHGLCLPLEQPSSLQAKPTRPKGRKANKPVKVSRQFDREGDGVIQFLDQDVRSHGSQQHNDSGAPGDSGPGTEDPGPDTDGVSNTSTIRHMKWDKRMRLTITKDFRKERRQSLTGGVMTGDDRPARRTFTCVVCQQAFLQASDCLEHMYTHTESVSPDQLEPASGHEHCDDDNEHCDDDNGVEYDDDVDSAEDKGEKDVGGTKTGIGCPQCGLSFPSVSLLEKHIQQLHPEEKKHWECSSCSKTFLCSASLNRHRRQEHNGEKIYKCSICNRCFLTSSSLALHRKNHAGNRPFKCGVSGCDRNFGNASAANRHQRTHSDERPFVCIDCGKAFKAQNHLREHTRLHTGERPFVCEICGAGFAQSNGLKSHSKQHRIDRDNQCDICNKAFTHPKSLSLHMKIHSGEKPYTCQLCERTFRTACNLGAHKKLKHGLVTGKVDKEFTCDECGAAFSHACNLGVHKKKKHSNLPVSLEKNFVCEICDMKFSAACNLGAHRKIKHAEETEEGRNVLDCEICGAKFYRACNLSGHKKRKHGETAEMKEADKPFVCSLCNLRCATLENLQEHQSKIHCSMPPFPGELNAVRKDAGREQTETLAFDFQTRDQQLAFLSAESRNQSSISLDTANPDNSTTFTNSATIPEVVEKRKDSTSNGSFISQPHNIAPQSPMLEQHQSNQSVFSAPSFDSQAFFSSANWF
ncbi:zinc finger protein 93-like [Littorina saxatilis]|uniref:C2H2-type domain-containing protein n=1 Tax=Littorina saxatilis TaxID=31220 RepID=A0AAN9GP53_9CAEN